MGEEAAQNNSKRSRVKSESPQRMFSSGFGSSSSHASGFSPMQKILADFLDVGCRDDVDSKVYRFLYSCGVSFNVLHSPYWHEMVQSINGAPKGYRSPGYDKAGTMGLDRERAKINRAFGKFTNDCPTMGYPLYLMGRQMLKAIH